MRNEQTRLMRYYYPGVVMDSYGQELIEEHQHLFCELSKKEILNWRGLAMNFPEQHEPSQRECRFAVCELHLRVHHLGEAFGRYEGFLAYVTLKRLACETAGKILSAAVTRTVTTNWIDGDGKKGRLSLTRIAIDTGGTFTDCVYPENGKLVDVRHFSTPHDPGCWMGCGRAWLYAMGQR